jgi:hypothetical protein
MIRPAFLAPVARQPRLPARAVPVLLRAARTAALLAAAASTLAACDRVGRDPSAPPLPRGSLLEPVAEHRQPRAPIDAFVVHLDGFQFRSGDLSSQHRVQQYCAQLGEEVLQCALFDGTGPQAKLTGVEYVISERLFSALPDEEKAYWHSQVHEVKAGVLVAPGLPEQAEHALAARLVRTYAKAWRLWPDGDSGVPTGVPQLMMGFTNDGQLDPVLLAERDRELGVASAEKRRQRADIPEAPPAPGADAWRQGRIAQVQGTIGAPARGR